MFARVRSFWRGLTRPAQLEHDMDEEMRFHVDMETERLLNTRDLPPDEARRQARLAFGGAQRYKAEGRDARGLTRISDFSLDVKLAVRMLAKYPAVTIVGVLAMSIGIGLGAAYIEVVNDFLHPTLPLDEGGRIVGVQTRDLAANKPELRVLSDFAAWRTDLVFYAIGLAVLAAAIAGVMPACKATGARVQARLRHAGGVHGSSLRFGGIWTAVIVVQVAFAVLLLPPAMVSISALAGTDRADPGFTAEEYVSARVEMEADQRSASEFQGTIEELRRRLLGRPDISDVTFASRLPGMVHPEPWIEMDAVAGDRGRPEQPWVMPASVDEHFFGAFGARIVAGRGFTAADRSANPGVVVVNETFIAKILRGRNAIGRRIRYQTRIGQEMATGQPPGITRAAAREPGSWYDIVGVVSDLGMDTNREVFHSGIGAGIYHPLSSAAMESGGSHSVRIAFHVREGGEAIATHLRQVAQGVHPSLRLYDIHSMDGPFDQATQAGLRSRFLTTIAGCFAVIALVISAANSVMSFTVWRHTRDIGIRIALGASRRRIVTAVFSRAMIQIGAGLLLGALLWVYFIVVELKPAQDSDRVGLFAATSVALTLVGLVACGIPVIRALRIEPIEALRDA